MVKLDEIVTFERVQRGAGEDDARWRRWSRRSTTVATHSTGSGLFKARGSRVGNGVSLAGRGGYPLNLSGDKAHVGQQQLVVLA